MTHPVFHILNGYLTDPSHWLKNILWRFPKTISDRDIVFVVGTPRSGTTLLQRILSVHDDLYSIQGETGLFSYQNLFIRKHFGLDLEVRDEIMNNSVDVVDFFNNALHYMENYNGNKIFIEKTPQHVLKLGFIIKHFPRARIIHIYRDGRDCYCSSLHHPGIPQAKSLSYFARYWNRCIDSAYKDYKSNNIHHLCYENLSRDPAGEMQKTMSFLGLEFTADQLDKEKISADKRSKTKVFAKLNEPVNMSSCGRWKSELSQYEKEEFYRIAGNNLKMLGYEED